MINLGNTNRKIKKDDLLKKYTQEQIMEIYSGVPLTNEYFNSPFRVDNTPSCGYFYLRGNLTLNDLGGYFMGDCFSVAAKVYGMTDDGTVPNEVFSKLVNKIHNDLEKRSYIPSPKAIEVRKNHVVQNNMVINSVNWRAINWSKEDVNYWSQFGHEFLEIGGKLRCHSLEEYNVYPISNFWINRVERFEMRYKKDNPTYLYKVLSKDGKQYGYKVYKPLTKDKSLKWRSTSTSDPLNPIIQGFEQIVKSELEIDYLIWSTSLKDAMCINLAIESVRGYAYSSESFIPPKALNKTRFYFADNDIPGLRQAVKVRRRFPDIKIIWIPRDKGVKDIAEYVSKYGLNNFREFLKDATR